MESSVDPNPKSPLHEEVNEVAGTVGGRNAIEASSFGSIRVSAQREQAALISAGSNQLRSLKSHADTTGALRGVGDRGAAGVLGSFARAERGTAGAGAGVRVRPHMSFGVRPDV